MAENMKVFSNKQEKLVADALGGYPVGGSGAMPANPGDVRTYDWLVECKTHAEPGQSIFFDIDVWKKIQNEAIGASRKPVLIVDDGSQDLDKTWCLCREINLNLQNVVTVDLPVKIRKNITCKHDKLIKVIKERTKEFVAEFYKAVAFEVDWAGDRVIVMPFSTFKELFDL